MSKYLTLENLNTILPPVKILIDKNANDLNNLSSLANKAILYIEQSNLTAEQKAQARANIDASNVKSLNDLSDSVIINEIQQNVSRISIEMEQISDSIQQENNNDTNAYIRYQDGKVEVGHTENQYKIQIGNDGVDITQSTSPMAHIGQNAISAPTFEADRMLKIGNHTAKISVSGALIFN